MATKKNDNLFLVLFIGGGLFGLGWFLSTKKKAAEKAAGQVAVQQGLNYVQSQADVTRNWINQLTNTWKQIWK